MITKNEFYGVWEKNQKGYILVLMPRNGSANTIFEPKIPSSHFFTR